MCACGLCVRARVGGRRGGYLTKTTLKLQLRWTLQDVTQSCTYLITGYLELFVPSLTTARKFGYSEVTGII